MRVLIGRFFSDRAGATAIEYALIGVLVSVVALGGFSLVAGSLKEIYDGQGQAVHNATLRYR